VCVRVPRYFRPPPLSEKLIDVMRRLLMIVLGAHIAVSHYALLRADNKPTNNQRTENLTRLVIICCLWGTLVIFRYLLRKPELALTTGGASFDDPTMAVGTDPALERYECPAANKARHLRGLEEKVVGILQAKHSSTRVSGPGPGRNTDGAPREGEEDGAPAMRAAPTKQTSSHDVMMGLA